MRVHFIAIGGAAMHNLAIALSEKGYSVTGSDDALFEPSLSRLKSKGLLPKRTGWDPGKITGDLDAVILGMHAKQDNPELVKAQALGVPIFSFPQFIYEQTKDKYRVVIGGSHGKTTVTSMIMHVLQMTGRRFDYLVGAQIDGFETMVGLSDDTDVAVFEGDEYLASPLDPRPKFHLYRPHLGVINGIAWDHVNVFPTYESYIEQFSKFADLIEPGGMLAYTETDQEVTKLIKGIRKDIRLRPYGIHQYHVGAAGFHLVAQEALIPVKVFGEHNMQNIAAARLVCDELGVSNRDFYSSISTFTGAARRLQLLGENGKSRVYLDFAHSPSKVGATVKAVRELVAKQGLVACLELHTFSSLNTNFLHQYQGKLDAADIAIVYYDLDLVAKKGLGTISGSEIIHAFGRRGLRVYSNREALYGELAKLDLRSASLLLMTSGSFSGMDLKALSQKLLDF